MTRRILAGRATSSSSKRAGAGTRTGLPLSVERSSARRLRATALIYAAAFLVMGTWGRVTAISMGHLTPADLINPNLFAAIGSILLSLIVAALLPRLDSKPTRVLDLGLIYMVLATFGIAFETRFGTLSHVGPEIQAQVHEWGVPYGVPFECLWLLIYPVLVPNKPVKILIASQLAALSGIGVLAISQASGRTSPDLDLARMWVSSELFTTHLTALIAFVVSRIIYSMGQQIRRAEEIGRYRLTERLGEGGMGTVWRAEHQMLARPAAVKLIRPDSVHGDAATILKRFQREAQATAALQSFHTITIYDYGVDDEGTFYYVMELLDGLDLETLVRKHGPQPDGRVIQFLKQVCGSLAEAHRRGLVHRDIKPANLYTCRIGTEVDYIKVLDFGLVLSTAGLGFDGGESNRLTQQGTLTGTPAYLAPEILTGESPLDGRADLYALGCVAYYLLTGVTVFEGPTAMAVAADHVKTPPTPPKQRSEIALADSLEELVLDLLKKDPGERPATAEEVAARLARIEPCCSWSPAAAREWWQLHRPTAVRDESFCRASTPATRPSM